MAPWLRSWFAPASLTDYWVGSLSHRSHNQAPASPKSRPLPRNPQERSGLEDQIRKALKLYDYPTLPDKQLEWLEVKKTVRLGQGQYRSSLAILQLLGNKLRHCDAGRWKEDFQLDWIRSVCCKNRAMHVCVCGCMDSPVPLVRALCQAGYTIDACPQLRHMPTPKCGH